MNLINVYKYIIKNKGRYNLSSVIFNHFNYGFINNKYFKNSNVRKLVLYNI